MSAKKLSETQKKVLADYRVPYENYKQASAMLKPHIAPLFNAFDEYMGKDVFVIFVHDNDNDKDEPVVELYAFFLSKEERNAAVNILLKEMKPFDSPKSFYSVITRKINIQDEIAKVFDENKLDPLIEAVRKLVDKQIAREMVHIKKMAEGWEEKKRKLATSDKEAKRVKGAE